MAVLLFLIEKQFAHVLYISRFFFIIFIGELFLNADIVRRLWIVIEVALYK